MRAAWMIRIMKYLLTRLCLISSCLIVSSCMDENRVIDVGSVYGKPIKYPYLANNDRVLQIEGGVKHVTSGSSKSEAVMSMGKPDEVNETQDKNNWTKRIGYSFVYLVRRDRENGSVNEKNEKLVRVHFNQEDIVTRIDFVGDWGKR